LFLFNTSIFVLYVVIPPMVVHNLIHVSHSVPFSILIYAHYQKPLTHYVQNKMQMIHGLSTE